MLVNNSKSQKNWIIEELRVIAMTRWDLLKEIMMLPDKRRSIGKAWPLFFFIIYHGTRSNKCVTSYPELHEVLSESPHTIKMWRDQLVERAVIKVIRGRSSMTLQLLSPYDSIVTCEQDDVAQIKMNGDPATRRLLDKVSSFNNMSLLPLVAELSSKLDKLEKKLE